MPFWMHLSGEIQMVALLQCDIQCNWTVNVHSNPTLYTLHSAVNPSLGIGREKIAKDKETVQIRIHPKNISRDNGKKFLEEKS